MTPLERWKGWARALKRQAVALYLASRDPRTPWYAKALALCVVGYALSPIDLIPDFIPVLGYLDDLILLPLGVALVVRLVPKGVWAESMARAEKLADRPTAAGRVAAAVIALVWIALLAAAIVWAARRVRG